MARGARTARPKTVSIIRLWAHRAADPIVESGRRVVFLSSHDENATAPVAALAKQLEVAQSSWESSMRAAGWCTRVCRTWDPFIFQDLFRRRSNRYATV